MTTVIAGVQLSIAGLKKVLQAIDDVERKIAIGVDNESGDTWQQPTVYFRSGTSDTSLPNKLEDGKQRPLIWSIDPGDSL